VGGVAARRTKPAARILRVFELAEDAIHVLVAVLLIGLAITLMGDLVGDVIAAIRGQDVALQTVLLVLDKTLVLFIVAELLHTVRITIRNRGSLNAEPFLVVALVAAVRRVLILTAEAEVSFQWNPQGIELTIMVGLILVLAASIVIWRRSGRTALRAGEAGDDVDRGSQNPGTEQI
jgi:hypothetical protein